MHYKLKKILICLCFLMCLFTMVACETPTTDTPKPNEPTVVKPNTDKPNNDKPNTPAKEETPKYVINYYLDNELIYTEKQTRAKNYNINCDKVIIGWFLDNTTDVPYDFSKELKSDLDLYAHSYDIKYILDTSFDKLGITEYYFSLQSETDYLKIYQTNDKINIGGFKYETKSGYIIEYRKTGEIFTSMEDDLFYWKTAQWDFSSGVGGMQIKYENCAKGWASPKYNSIIFNFAIKFPALANSPFEKIITNCEYESEKDTIENSIESYLNMSTAYLSIKLTDWKKEIFEGHYSTGSTYALNVTLNQNTETTTE